MSVISISQLCDDLAFGARFSGVTLEALEDDPGQPRRMQRTTIKGDYGLGSFENIHRC